MPFHSDVTGALSNVFNEKLVQIAVVAGVLFYVVANPAVFKFVDSNLRKLVNLNLSEVEDKICRRSNGIF